MNTRLVRTSRLRTIVATVVVTMAALFVAPSTASAAVPCGSAYTYYTTYWMYHGSTKVGHVSLYTASNRRLCAVAWTYGSERGVSRFRSIAIWDSNNMDGDNGTFTIYAGPVYSQYNGGGSCSTIHAFFGSRADPYAEFYSTRIACFGGA